MIVTRLMGGLGNQMFQYAAGWSLARRLGTELLVDRTWLESERKMFETPRRYELDGFRLRACFASPELVSALERRGDSPLNRLLNKIRLTASPVVFRETNHAFDARFEAISGNVLLVGYWQSEKYFAACADEIRSEFGLRDSPSDRNRELIEQMRATNSLSLHVRRGDYVSSETTHRFHGVMPIAYYRDAVQAVIERVGPVEIFVFSDDIDWCKRELEILGQRLHVVDHNTQDNEDMRLMSSCRHHILANSSFSWWGAWLNPDPGKVVVAPARWFQEPSVDTSDLLREGWLRL
jgi:hypothetical protein